MVPSSFHWGVWSSGFEDAWSLVQPYCEESLSRIEVFHDVSGQGVGAGANLRRRCHGESCLEAGRRAPIKIVCIVSVVVIVFARKAAEADPAQQLFLLFLFGVK